MAILEIGSHLRPEKSSFRQSMPAAFAQKRQARGPRGIEKYHCLAGKRAVLRGAERQYVDACLPAHFGRRAMQGNKRIGETGAFHVDNEPGVMRDGVELRDLLARVN